jgi:20S proteasome alpha/beta subunit
MTIGIGLLCDGGKHILLAADMRATYGEVSQHDQTGKLFDLPANFCGAIAGTISTCGDVISDLYSRMEKIPPKEMGIPSLLKTIEESYYGVATRIANEELWNSLRITLDQFHHDEKLVKDIRDEAKSVIRKTDIDVDLIVAGFVDEGPILLTATGGTMLRVRAETSPGNTIIGSGAIPALYWLNYRKQNTGYGLARSLLHIIEAKQFAELDHTVGPSGQFIALWNGGWKLLDGGRDTIQAWWDQYGLSSSDALDKEAYNEVFHNTFDVPKK